MGTLGNRLYAVWEVYGTLGVIGGLSTTRWRIALRKPLRENWFDRFFCASPRGAGELENAESSVFLEYTQPCL